MPTELVNVTCRVRTDYHLFHRQAAHLIALRHHDDVADESRAISHHLPQTHPHPDCIATTVLPNSGDGMSLSSILADFTECAH